MSDDSENVKNMVQALREAVKNGVITGAIIVVIAVTVTESGRFARAR